MTDTTEEQKRRNDTARERHISAVRAQVTAIWSSYTSNGDPFELENDYGWARGIVYVHPSGKSCKVVVVSRAKFGAQQEFYRTPVETRGQHCIEQAHRRAKAEVRSTLGSLESVAAAASEPKREEMTDAELEALADFIHENPFTILVLGKYHTDLAAVCKAALLGDDPSTSEEYRAAFPAALRKLPHQAKALAEAKAMIERARSMGHLF
jgi:hypothetical protein